MASKSSFNQIVLLSTAIIATLGLYFFGKTTQPIQSVEEGLISENTSQSISVDTDVIKDESQNLLTPEEKERLQTTPNNEKLAFWQSVDQYDMAAIIALEEAKEKGNFEEWDIAGDMSVRAFREVEDSTQKIFFIQNAVSSYQEALENQQNVNTKLKLAQVHTSLTGSIMEGVLLLREVLEEDPTNVQANYELGLLSIQSGQFDKGLERFSVLIDTKPDFIEPYILKAQILLELERKEEAKDVLNAAMDKTTNQEGLKALQEMKNSIN